MTGLTRPRSVVGTPGSGARSSEVRVSYFDPETGEPLQSRKRAPSGHGAREEHVRRRPALVDGLLYPSLVDAANACGCSRSHLSVVLRRGDSECNGHEVAYADGDAR